MKNKRPDNILIVKLSAIGDVVHALPFLEVMRQNFPNAKIDWLVEEESSPIVQGHQGIDRVIVSQRKSWQKRLLRINGRSSAISEIIRFLKEIRHEEYDLVVDLQGLFKSGLLVGVARGKRKVGTTGSREGSRIFLTERPVPVDYDQHAIVRYLQVAEHINCRIDSWGGVIPVDENAKRNIERLIDYHGIDEKRMIAINPMARWKTKLWERGHFSALADRIIQRFLSDVVFTGSRGDRKSIDDMIGDMAEKTKAFNLAGQTGLKELASLYAGCRLMISTDTGPMHIAAAMKCPVIALFGPTAPWRTGPYGKGHIIIQEEMTCSPCFKKKCEHVSCMKNITVDQVFSSVKAVMDDRAG